MIKKSKKIFFQIFFIFLFLFSYYLAACRISESWEHSINFYRQCQLYDFFRFFAKFSQAKIANFFSKRDRLDFSSDLNSTAKIRAASFFSFIFGHRETKNAILWNTLVMMLKINNSQIIWNLAWMFVSCLCLPCLK